MEGLNTFSLLGVLAPGAAQRRRRSHSEQRALRGGGEGEPWGGQVGPHGGHNRAVHLLTKVKGHTWGGFDLGWASAEGKQSSGGGGG